jgi:hypothetical protein
VTHLKNPYFLRDEVLSRLVEKLKAMAGNHVLESLNFQVGFAVELYHSERKTEASSKSVLNPSTRSRASHVIMKPKRRLRLGGVTALTASSQETAIVFGDVNLPSFLSNSW